MLQKKVKNSRFSILRQLWNWPESRQLFFSPRRSTFGDTKKKFRPFSEKKRLVVYSTGFKFFNLRFQFRRRGSERRHFSSQSHFPENQFRSMMFPLPMNRLVSVCLIILERPSSLVTKLFTAMVIQHFYIICSITCYCVAYRFTLRICYKIITIIYVVNNFGKHNFKKYPSKALRCFLVVLLNIF